MHPDPNARRRRARVSRRLALAPVAAAALLGLAQPLRAGQYQAEMMPHGPVETTEISGYRGTAFTLNGPDGGHAIYGLFSVERRDNPCYVALRTESLNDSARDGGDIRNLCGNDGTSSELGVAFEDSSFLGIRVFVSGIRVCMDRDQDRVKGFRIRGRKITTDGQVAELDAGEPTAGQAGGSDVGLSLVTEPEDHRPNCSAWMRWVECPGADQVATGLVAHFEAGNEPRSLTGVALQCRSVSRVSAAR